MGNPQHFSRELPRRGQQLLDYHYHDLSKSAGTGLPLKATFLLSISMPLIMLPYERIVKTKAHMNDATLDPSLEAAVAGMTSGTVQLQQTPFFLADTWEHAVLPKGAGFPNLAVDGLPAPVADDLDLPRARDAAAILPAETFLRIVRNALAHGGVLFLNAAGRTEHEAAVRRFAFVSTDRYNAQNLLFLRTSMKGYRDFLQTWSDWLQVSGLQKAMDEVVDLESPPENEETDGEQGLKMEA